MEKKVKKLLLKKETIVVLDGEKMSGIIGGADFNPCGMNAIFANGKCFCPENYDGNPYDACHPQETIIVTSVYCTSNAGCNSCNLTCGGCEA